MSDRMLKFFGGVGLVAAMFLRLAGAHAAVVGTPAGRGRTWPATWPSVTKKTITEASREYPVRMGGAVDGTMTRDPVSYGPYVQGWQPNVSVRMENVRRDGRGNP